MKRIISIIACMWISLSAFALDEAHPRLFLRGGEEQQLMENVRKDKIWSAMHDAIVCECDTICLSVPCERVIVGPRMHATSCEILRRVLFLSYAYRTTGVEKYAARAEKEMLHVADFVDWHPYHFLDVSEIAAAFAIGYDWLYNYLSEESRNKILDALIDKGLTTSETGGEGNPEYNLRWITIANNWNQVCHGCLTLAAIATYSENKEQAERIIRRASEKILIPMNHEFPPMGCFPEGFGYWAFGTQFNILFVDSMWKFFGRESVREHLEVPGFIESGNYSQQLITPSLRTFGYSDNSTRIYLEPAVMWFNTVREDPRMYYRQKALFNKFEESRSYVKTIKNRLIPFMLIWGAGVGDEPCVSLYEAEEPTDCYYLGKGNNDICVMRSGWGPDDAYLGFKGGKVNNPHGHMDIGSFYFEDGGVRWSLDLGSDDYGSVQTHGIGLFDMSQKGDRWLKLTKYNNFAHSTTYPDGEYQNVNVNCPLEGSSEAMSASVELAELYGDKLVCLNRSVSLKGHRASIMDYIEAGDDGAPMVWNMTTEAVRFKRRGRNIKLFAPDGKQLKMKVKCRCSFDAELVPATPANEFEDQNDGISFFRLRYEVPARSKTSLSVRLIPKR